MKLLGMCGRFEGCPLIVYLINDGATLVFIPAACPSVQPQAYKRSVIGYVRYTEMIIYLPGTTTPEAAERTGLSVLSSQIV